LAAVITEKQGHIRLITLNRPERLNAINADLLTEMGAALAEASADHETRAVIITGAGDRAFSAGADLKEREGMSAEEVRQYIGAIRDTFTAVQDLRCPAIAAINGLALGGGTELALACDLRIAVEGTWLGLPEVSLGIIPGAGGTQRLPRLIGLARAKELIFTGRRLEAGEALALGLVNRVVPIADLMGTALALAEGISANAPVAVAQAKLAIDRGMDLDLRSALILESQAYEVCIPTRDRLEGLRAFRERRRPVFIGE
jgi:enoyl-CoA hydratase/carnithine racemase